MVELTRKDIIPRPEDIPVKTASAPASAGANKNPLAEFKEILATVKEFKKMADEMGIKIPGAPQAEPAPEHAADRDPPPAPANPAGQLLLLVQMLKVKYGDISINQLIAALVQEYGDRKLSSIGGKK